MVLGRSLESHTRGGDTRLGSVTRIAVGSHCAQARQGGTNPLARAESRSCDVKCVWLTVSCTCNADAPTPGHAGSGRDAFRTVDPVILVPNYHNVVVVDYRVVRGDMWSAESVRYRERPAA
jgi:hypothetical protein